MDNKEMFMHLLYQLVKNTNTGYTDIINDKAKFGQIAQEIVKDLEYYLPLLQAYSQE